MALDTPLTPPELAARFRALGYWKDVTVFERFQAAAARYPHKIAIIDGERQFTYSGLRATIDRIATHLLGRLESARFRRKRRVVRGDGVDSLLSSDAQGSTRRPPGSARRPPAVGRLPRKTGPGGDVATRRTRRLGFR